MVWLAMCSLYGTEVRSNMGPGIATPNFGVFDKLFSIIIIIIIIIIISIIIIIIILLVLFVYCISIIDVSNHQHVNILR